MKIRFLYHRLIDSYVQRGRALSRIEVGELCANSELALKNLVESKLIVLDANGNLAGAYPFTSEEREHQVQFNGVTAHCMCALDALAVSPMFNLPTEVNSICHTTGAKIQIQQSGTEICGGSQDAWFGINWGAAVLDSICADSLCMEMIFLANESVAHEWLAQSPDTHEIFDLLAAVHFAAGFFIPLTEN